VLKVGAIGVGHLGRHHARVYSELSDCELVGLYDTDAARAEEVADGLATTAFGSLAELLAGVDAVSIAVPTTDHHSVALESIDAGVHVLIEKPIASSVQEARDIVDAARDRGLVVQVGHIERFNPAIRAALDVLTEPRFIEADRLATFVPRGTDVAVVLDLMIHDIDLILSIVDSPVAHIDAVGVPVLSPSVDIANARLVFENGCIANVTASRASRERVRKIRFFQSDAYVTIDCAAPRAQVFRKKDVSPDTLRRLASGEISGGLSDVVDYEDLALDDAEPLKLELAAFVEAVSSGGRPVVSGDDGLEALSVVLEILAQIGRLHPDGARPVSSV
jgi:predicted dehydrogenase